MGLNSSEELSVCVKLNSEIILFYLFMHYSIIERLEAEDKWLAKLTLIITKTLTNPI